jgi:hypothetical protein
MKNKLLFAFALTASISQAQQLDLTNEPAIGQGSIMYVCDTLTNSYATTTGTGVIWDYSQLLGLNGTTKTLEILDATLTADAASFPTSTKVMSIQGVIKNYFNSTSTDRISQGFVYNEPNLGTVLATFDADNETILNYPFLNSSYFVDNFSGMLSFTFNGIPQNPTCNGSIRAEIDGQGTLLLPSSNTHTNVIRYKSVDTVFTQVIFVTTLDVQLVRTQYEYYDIANGNLPLFVYTNVQFGQQGSTNPLLEQTNVISSIQPLQNVGLENISASEFSVYPNPSEGIINFKGSFDSNASAIIYDQSGRVVSTIETLVNGQSIDLSQLKKGMYLVSVNNNGVQTTKTISLR